MDFGVLAVVVIVLALTFLYESHYRSKRRTAWSEVATRYGLRFAADEIHGTIAPFGIRVWEETRGAGKSRYTVTMWRFSFDGPTTMPHALSITPEGLLQKLGKFVGGEDVQLDLPDVDSRMIVRGEHPEHIRSWAQQPLVARALRNLVRSDAEKWSLTNYELILEDRRRPHTAKEVGDLLIEYLELAEGFAGVKGDTQPFNDHLNMKAIPTMPSSSDEVW